jgi:hypothetical protein
MSPQGRRSPRVRGSGVFVGVTVRTTEGRRWHAPSHDPQHWRDPHRARWFSSSSLTASHDQHAAEAGLRSSFAAARFEASTAPVTILS